MRYCVLGDVHGNLEALEAVVADARRRGAERFACVGDIVGYGASPSECIDRVQSLTTQIVAGNHDCAVVERTDLEYFNPFARDAVVWTRRQLSPQDKCFLHELPLTLEVNDLVLAHATLYEPALFGYIESDFSARQSFRALDGSLAFVGHSHVPVVFFYDPSKDLVLYTKDLHIDLDGTTKVIVNVGSVGQPRDEDPRACYALYDSSRRTVTLRRVEYNVEAAKRKILAADLPDVLGRRLLFGR